MSFVCYSEQSLIWYSSVPDRWLVYARDRQSLTATAIVGFPDKCEVLPALMPYAGPSGGLGWRIRDSDARFGNGLSG
jgi:hypothetical protein